LQLSRDYAYDPLFNPSQTMKTRPLVSLIVLATLGWSPLAIYARDLPLPADVQNKSQSPDPAAPDRSGSPANSGSPSKSNAVQQREKSEPVLVSPARTATPGLEIPSTPISAVFGNSVILEFRMTVPLPADSASPPVTNDLLTRFSVGIDNLPPKRVAASIQTSTALQGGQILQLMGSAAFAVDSSLVPAPLWRNEHLIYLVNDETLTRSNFAKMIVEGSLLSRALLAGVGGLIILSLLAYGLWALVHRSRPVPAMQAPAVVAADSRSIGISSVTEAVPQPVPLPDVPASLLAALAGERGVLVLGGRASARSGFPSEAALVQMLLQRLRGELPERMFDTLDKAVSAQGSRFLENSTSSKIMDAIASSVSRDRLASEITKIFSDIRPASQFYDILARLPWNGVISLTWDTFADGIFMASGSPNKSWRKFTLDESSELPSAVRSGDRLFLRPFGDLDRTPTLSLSMEQFRRNLTRWPEFQRQIGLLLQSQTFVFFGVDIEMIEQFLQSVSSDLDVSEPRHFAVVPYRIENDLLQSSLSRCGVQILAYEEDPHDQGMFDFAQMLAKQSRSFKPSVAKERPGNAGRFASERIEGVKLTNIGLFDSLELKFETKPSGDLTSTPWTVVFGPNGCGKSTILRAIGLVFAGISATDVASRLLQSGKNEGQVEVQFGSNALKIRLVRDRDKVLLQTGPASPVEGGLALVLGFPALRGGPSPNPRGAAQLQARSAEPADLFPMIYGDVDKRLGNFKQWLINILEQAGRNIPRAVAMRDLLDGIIRDVVPGEFRRFAPLDSSYVIKVKTDDTNAPSVGDIPFDELSQGMTSIFNWLGVLAQRIYDFYPDADKPEKNYAVVMIDEIDAHLHPDWQRRLVELTKKFFPNVQILATSHSPLLAGALRKQELCVLERDPLTKIVAPLPISIDPYGMRAQFILMSRIFGLTSDRNPELEQRISRHVELAQKRKRTPEEEAELATLIDDLQDFRYAGVRPVRSAPPAPTEELAEAMRGRFGSPSPANDPPGSPSGAIP
jgi:energy-coupling factor transporter ATP-binding protein EcfA2